MIAGNFDYMVNKEPMSQPQEPPKCQGCGGYYHCICKETMNEPRYKIGVLNKAIATGCTVWSDDLDPMYSSPSWLRMKKSSCLSELVEAWNEYTKIQYEKAMNQELSAQNYAESMDFICFVQWLATHHKGGQ